MSKKRGKRKSLRRKAGGFLTDVVLGRFMSKVGQGADALLDKVDRHTHVVVSKLVSHLSASLLVLAGSTLLLVAGALHLMDTYGLSPAQVLVGLGMILLVAGLFLKVKHLEKEK